MFRVIAARPAQSARDTRIQRCHYSCHTNLEIGNEECQHGQRDSSDLLRILEVTARLINAEMMMIFEARVVIALVMAFNESTKKQREKSNETTTEAYSGDMKALIQ